MSDIEAKPPERVWTRPMRLAPVGFFKAIAKFGVDAGTGNWAGAGKDAIDVAASLGLDSDAGDQAGLLITRALGRALAKVTDDYKMGFAEEVATDAKQLAKDIDAELASLELVIDHRFLEHPRALPIVAIFQEKVRRWLEPVDLRGRHPDTIVGALPEHFVYALHREALDRSGDYDRLFAEFNGEFDEPYRHERSWAGYRAWFAQRLARPVFGGRFRLPQVFIWPRAYHVEKDAPGPGSPRLLHRAHEHEVARERRVVGALRETLDAWITANDPHDAMRVISGDPGAGKSSFARMYTDHRLKRGDRALYVALHRIDPSAELGASIRALCEEVDPFPRVDLEGEAAEDQLLLVLDGLDELAKQGRIGAKLADEFVAEVQRKVGNRNLGGLHLRVLICGRPIAVQGIEPRFRKPGQVLHLLPYCLTEAERTAREVIWVDPDDLLADDQRNAWWAAYGDATGRPERALPDALAGEALLETTRQPLLGYLLALVHEDAQARNEPLGPDISHNEIYARLIDRVHEREWDERPSHPLLQNMDAAQFGELLEDMALAAWHDGERVTTLAALERLQDPQQLERLQAYAEHCDNVGQLFTAFYMRRRGHRSQGEETFEFTHKSFAEYLAARRIVAQVEIAVAEIERAQEPAAGGRRQSSMVKGPRQILVDWLKVCGPAAISHDLLPCLHREVALREIATPGLAARWQRGLASLIEHVLHEGSPCEKLEPRPSFLEERRQARNAEEALLALLCCCAEASRELSRIEWPEPTSFGSWLRWLRDQPSAEFVYRTVAGRCLAHLDLQGAMLSGADLCVANLDSTNLDSANLHSTNLHSANLHSASLISARLRSANLHSANLHSANLHSAYLHCANLDSAYLHCANLDSAYLHCANLESANLDSANLHFAYLHCANLDSAYLHCANLASANLHCAYLHCANLESANLDSANLHCADLESANLDNANLRNATISPVQLATTKGTPRRLPDGK